VDHRALIDINDPLLYKMSGVEPEDILFDEFGIGRHPEPKDPIDDGWVFVPFLPTCEELAKFFFGVLATKLSGVGQLKVKSVTIYEGATSSATYVEKVYNA